MGSSWGRIKPYAFWDNADFPPMRAMRAHDHCLTCIPVRTGAVLIGVGCLLYGIIGFAFAIYFAIEFQIYKTVYQNKLDLLCYLMLITIIIAWFIVSSIILLCGICMHHDQLVLVFLWSTLVYMFVNIIINICYCLYCVFRPSCFGGCGVAFVLPNVVVVVAYSFIWWYLLVVVNEARIDL